MKLVLNKKKMPCKSVPIVYFLLCVLQFIYAAPITNITMGGAGYSDLQTAVDAAAEGHEIRIQAVTLTRGAGLNLLELTNGVVIHAKTNLTLRGGYDLTFTSQSGYTILDGGAAGTNTVMVMQYLTNIKLDGFAVTGGTNMFSNGGGASLFRVYNSCISNCIFSNNYATNGGGLSLLYSDNNIIDAVFTNNRSKYNGGGMYSYYGSSNVIRGTIIKNYCSLLGGGFGLWYGSSNEISAAVVNNNSAVVGGGISLYLSGMNLFNGLISNNTAISGAGIYCYQVTSNTFCGKFTKNSAVNLGGGISFGSQSKYNILNGVFTENTSGSGGGLHMIDCLQNTISGFFVNNKSGVGGGVYLQASRSNLFSGAIASNNTANYGGGIYLNVCTNNTLTGTVNKNNSTNGGGIYINSGCSNVIDSVVSDNSASAGTGAGGGIFITTSHDNKVSGVISNNTSILGAGVCLYNCTNFHMSNALLKENTASGYCGGLNIVSGDSVFIENSTFLSNVSAATNGAIVLDNITGSALPVMISNCSFIGAGTNSCGIYEKASDTSGHLIYSNLFWTNTLTYLYYDFVDGYINYNEVGFLNTPNSTRHDAGYASNNVVYPPPDVLFIAQTNILIPQAGTNSGTLSFAGYVTNVTSMYNPSSVYLAINGGDPALITTGTTWVSNMSSTPLTDGTNVFAFIGVSPNNTTNIQYQTNIIDNSVPFGSSTNYIQGSVCSNSITYAGTNCENWSTITVNILYTNGAVYAVTNTSPTFEFTIDTLLMGDGPQLLSLRVSNSVGLSYTATWTNYITNSVITAGITNPSPLSWITNSPVSFSGWASNTVGQISGIRFGTNATGVFSLAGGTTSNWVTNLTVDTFPVTNVFYITVSNQYNGLKTIIQTNFIDLTAPNAALTNVIAGQIVADIFTLRGTNSDEQSGVNAAWFTITNTAGAITNLYGVQNSGEVTCIWDSSSVTDGPYFITLLSSNNAGLFRRSTPLSFSVNNSLPLIAQTNTLIVHYSTNTGILPFKGYATNINSAIDPPAVYLSVNGEACALITNNTDWATNFNSTMLNEGANSFSFMAVSSNYKTNWYTQTNIIDNSLPYGAVTNYTQGKLIRGPIVWRGTNCENWSDVALTVLYTNGGHFASTNTVPDFEFSVNSADFPDGALSLRLIVSNSVGLSYQYNWTNYVTNAVMPPDAPGALSAVGGHTKVLLSWMVPATNGGAAITNYSVDYKTSTDSVWVTFTNITDTNTIVTYLSNGISYDFRVSAANTNGTGPYSETASAIPGSGLTAVITSPGSDFISGLINVNGYCSGDINVLSNVQVILEPGGGWVMATTNASNFSAVINTSAAPDGLVNVRVMLIDTSGYQLTNHCRVYSNDNTPPIVHFSITNAAERNAITVKISASDLFGITGLYYTLDGSVPTPASTAAALNAELPITSSSTLTVLALDPSGNRGTNSSMYTIITDAAVSNFLISAIEPVPFVPGVQDMNITVKKEKLVPLRLILTDINGRVLKILTDSTPQNYRSVFTFDGRIENGKTLGRGVYRLFLEINGTRTKESMCAIYVTAGK